MKPRYLLDTNVCIEIIRGQQSTLQKRMRVLAVGEIAICSIVWAELELGARLSTKGYARVRAQIEPFLQLPQFVFDRTCAEHHAIIRTALQTQGRMIGCHDLQIAAIALANDLILVTHNTREFARVPGPKFEDWKISSDTTE
jgi:tRNA(fMet)-specific endonuclease VapC